MRPHDIHGLAFLDRKAADSGQQELSTAFKVLSLRRAQLLLNAPADEVEARSAAVFVCGRKVFPISRYARFMQLGWDWMVEAVRSGRVSTFWLLGSLIFA